MFVKKYTLKLHQSNFSEESLLLNAKDFPDIRKDDIVRIYSADDDFDNNQLVIKVKCLKKEGEMQKNTVSIEQGLASRFGLHAFQSVVVQKVDPEDISLDMIEVLFKDQYVSRSDMWRLKRYLVGSCTCVEEKVEFCDIRAQVNELWINGSKVKCGLVADSTRIVLRSASALVYIFIQMSKEMWDFDGYGQLHFEKAVNGFLKELFTKWKDKCYHEFTLVLFSSLEEFPEDVRYVVHKDYRGLYYIDFYYCIAHHERSEDYSPFLFLLKKLFNEYTTLVKIPGCPPGYNSSASEGNFLEAINMSLNVFEKHYIDRNFDRTGQIVVCVTPGVGVFDVDRDLTILTKERMIDNGIGSDLVCLGKRPLHAVPLFKYHRKTRMSPQRPPVHSFNIPHWINCSFYSLNPFLDEGTVGIKHIPRADLQLKKFTLSSERSIQSPARNIKSQRPDLPSLLARNFDEFDDEIFSSPDLGYNGSMKTYDNQSNAPRHSSLPRRSISRIRTISDGAKQTTFEDQSSVVPTSPLHVPNLLSKQKYDIRTASSLGPASNLEKYFTIKEEDENGPLLVGSAHSFKPLPNRPKQPPQRSLINPFITTRMLPPITSNRRRWVHTYPVSSVEDGCWATSPEDRSSRRHSERVSENSDQYEEELISDMELVPNFRSSTGRSTQSVVGSVNSSEYSNDSTGLSGRFNKTLRHLNSIGDKEFFFSPGINWKTQKFPACLPITNDYFPSRQRLITEYTERPYNVILDHDDQYMDLQSLTARELFLELVNQRLCQGFQLVVPNLSTKRPHYDSSSMCSGRRSPMSIRKDTSFTSTESTSPVYSKISANSNAPQENEESYTLNHGRQYHIISMANENDISVQIYKPRHVFSASSIEYKYLLWAVGRDRFRLTLVKFAHEQYESYHWSYQDNCVCTSGHDSDFRIQDSIKYWRSKFVVIPALLSRLRYQKAETEASIKESRKTRYDLFSTDEPPEENLTTALDGMVKFFHFINKIRISGSGPGTQQYKMKDNLHASPHLASSISVGSLPTAFPQDATSTVTQSNFSPGRESSTHASMPDMQSKSYDEEKRGQFSKMIVTPEKEIVENLTSSPCSSEDCAINVYNAMLDPNLDFSFLQHQGRLCEYSFLSFDAIHWCLKKRFGLEKISDVVSLFETLRKMKYICHASGDQRHPFIYGYYLFYLITDHTKTEEHFNIQNFDGHWLELGFGSADQEIVASQKKIFSAKPKSVLSRLIENDSKSESKLSSSDSVKPVKTVLIHLHNKHKTQRVEWCQLQYPSMIQPCHGSIAFSFNVQWMVATATCLFEMLYGWLREASRSNLYLLPSPNDPFAFPDSEKDAYPLHCPLFVPLNMQGLSNEIPEFKDLLSDVMTCRRRIVEFMEKIAIRFGFLRYNSLSIGGIAANSAIKNSRRFVHYTGQVFLEIPVTNDMRVQGRTVTTHDQLNRTFRMKAAKASRTHEKREINLGDCGFYLSVNRMLTKRWRSATCDDCPVDKMDADFVLFCTNGDGRLVDLYKNVYL